MDAAAESGRNPVRKHQNRAGCGELAGRRETGKPKLPRESIFPGANEAPLSYSRLKILSRETASAFPSRIYPLTGFLPLSAAASIYLFYTRVM